MVTGETHKGRRGYAVLTRGVLRIRAVEAADLPLLQEWQAQDAAALFDEFRFPSPVCLQRQYAEDGFCSETKQMLMVDDKNLGPVGALYREQLRPGVFRVHLVLGDAEHHGQGIGTTALEMAAEDLFSRYPVERIQAEVDSENEAGQHILAKAGFHREALLRRWRFHHGQWRDSVVFCRLRQAASDPADLVRRYWECMAQQRYQDLAQILSEDVEVLWPNTKERFVGADGFIAVNCQYPGTWQAALDVLETWGQQVVTVARVFSGEDSLHVISWFRVGDGRIVQIKEFFADDMEPPDWRQALDVAKPWVDSR